MNFFEAIYKQRRLVPLQEEIMVTTVQIVEHVSVKALLADFENPKKTPNLIWMSA